MHWKVRCTAMSQPFLFNSAASFEYRSTHVVGTNVQTNHSHTLPAQHDSMYCTFCTQANVPFRGSLNKRVRLAFSAHELTYQLNTAQLVAPNRRV